MNYSDQEIEDMVKKVVEKHGPDAGQQFLEFARAEQLKAAANHNVSSDPILDRIKKDAVEVGENMVDVGKGLGKGGAEALAATIGQSVGARFGRAAPVAVPALGFIGGAGMNVINQLYSDQPFKPGEALQVGLSSAIPGKAALETAGRSMVQGMPEQVMGELIGKTVQTITDEKRLPTMGELGVAGARGYFGAKMGAMAGTGKASAEEAARYTNDIVRNTNVKEMRKAGYQIDAALANKRSAVAAEMNTAAGGQTTVQREMVAQNQPITNQIAREDIGLAPNVELRDINLSYHISKLKQPEREIQKIGTDLKVLVEKLQDARDDAAKLWKDYRNPDLKGARSPMKKEAQAMDKRVAQLEGMIDEALISEGRDDLMQEFIRNRRLISKTMIVKDALNAGDVDAHAIAQVNDKAARKLDGGLAFIARAYETMPQVMRLSPETQAAAGTGLSPLRAAAVAGLTTAGGGTPAQAGMAGAAAALSPYIARGVVSSRPYQAFMSQPNYNLNDPGFQSNLARFLTQGALRQ